MSGTELLTLGASDDIYAKQLEFAESMEPEKDLCSPEVLDALRDGFNADGGEPDALWKTISLLARHDRTGEVLPGGGTILKNIRGMGAIIDWRGSSWSAPNGGHIRARLGVQHIPVIHNVRGFADLVTLNNVLTDQGLRVHHGTDSEGNVALYCAGDRLCFQAKGANQVSWGTENMHFGVGEPWSRRQLRASAWIVQLEKKHCGTGRGRASLGEGDGVVRIHRGGQTTHERVAFCAGFKNRSDPGPGYDFEYVDHAISFFETHGHFEGA
jgi:hypothetical protein